MSEKARRESRYYPQGLPDGVRRLAICMCYDKDGIIDDYIPYLLKDLKENLTRLVVVVNGKLTADGRKRLEALTHDLLVRENEGFDAGAWKEAMIDYLGWDQIAEYDELVLLNDSFFGPLYPFREVFDEMAKRPVDFWGLTAHAKHAIGPDLCPYPYLPAHIQSYFIVIRKKMHTSYKFKRYWEGQPCYQSRDEVIARNEVVFTKHFSDCGFTWDTFVDTTDIDGDIWQATNQYAFSPYELIKNRRYPLLKRSNFGLAYSEYLGTCNGMQMRRCLDYIMSETNYDATMIFKNVLRIYNVADIFTNLHLQYVLPKELVVQERQSSSRAVIIFSLRHMERLDLLRPYMSGIPSYVDVILVTKPKESLDAVYQMFSPILGGRLRVVLAEGLGRELSALLVAAAPYLKEYDLIGFCHDKGPHKGEPTMLSRDFQEIIVENTIGTGAYVENVLNLFESHPEIGLLAPPPPLHGYYFENFLSRFWGGGCFEQTKALAERLGLNVDISEDKWPLALGTAFWCRRDALAPLFDYPWSYDDFPPEPISLDGTMGHGLERLFPFVAQHQGYLSGWVMTDEYASLEINNMHYRVDQLLHGGSNMPVVQIGLKGALVNYIKKHLPKPLWGFAKKAKQLLRW